ncbi:short-chain dehydrogenase/reductase SDR [Karstenula rhodostoma CBS 690.94]|uniref:Short-chain dehydrogenase/reductase SDR n=1 Tax=Karstenula rhodostoma CBS 690.94 TaxID=1392251 RepID=A0A9P4P4U9_9PLEO|nr:short-chain dehydrogenase/reductase SDR [Karstenula rhodostoma CBS 690.94]
MADKSDQHARQALDRLDILASHLSNVKAPTGRLTKLSRSLNGRKSIVTGAASGMGRETAKLLADEGVQVAVLDLDHGKVQAVVDEINAVHSGRAKGWVCDVADRNRIKQVCKEVIEAFGGLDILINNAGVSLGGGAFENDDSFESRWDKTLEINISALAIFIRACVPALLKSDAARVVNIASTEHFVTGPANAAYSATKSAVTGLTRAFAVELGKYGNITVNTICPGPIITGMTARISPEQKEAYAKRRVPLRRYADPEEVAQMITNVCLPASSYLHGTTIPVDGGMTIRHT